MSTSKPTLYYDPSYGAFRVQDVIALHLVGHNEEGTTHTLTDRFLTWDKGSGIITTKTSIYKPVAEDALQEEK